MTKTLQILAIISFALLAKNSCMNAMNPAPAVRYKIDRCARLTYATDIITFIKRIGDYIFVVDRKGRVEALDINSDYKSTKLLGGLPECCVPSNMFIYTSADDQRWLVISKSGENFFYVWHLGSSHLWDLASSHREKAHHYNVKMFVGYECSLIQTWEGALQICNHEDKSIYVIDWNLKAFENQHTFQYKTPSQVFFTQKPVVNISADDYFGPAKIEGTIINLKTLENNPQKYDVRKIVDVMSLKTGPWNNLIHKHWSTGKEDLIEQYCYHQDIDRIYVGHCGMVSIWQIP